MTRPVPPRLRIRPWQLFGGLALLSIPVYYALPGLFERLRAGADPAVGQATLYDALAAASAIAIVIGVLLNRPARKLPWLLLAAGQGLFAAGDVIWDVQWLALGEQPFPSISDVAYLAAYPLFTAALGMFVYHRLPRQRWRWLIDLGIVAGALSLVLWLLMVDPILADPAYTPIARMIALAYPIADMALLAAIVSGSLSPRPSSTSWLLVAGGFVSLLAADIAFALFPDLQASGGPIDALYLVPYALWGAAALHPDMVETGAAVVSDRLLTTRRLAILAAAALLPPVLLAAHQLIGLEADLTAIGAAWVGLTVLVLLDVLGLIRDQQAALERRQALEAELFEARKLESVGRLAGGIAHDFNNILTAIIGFSDLAIAEAPNADVDSIRRIRESAQRAAALVQKLLAFSRKQVLQAKPVDLVDAIHDTEPVLRQLLGEHILLALELPAEPVAVVADRTQLDQVLLNLSLNARDAMPEGGRLTITLATEDVDEASRRWPDMVPGRYAVLSVADTGVGMEAATLSHIFEPFFTTKETGKGTGLGLATTYGIVRQSNGYIDVRSERYLGTVFDLYLPTVVDPLAPGMSLPAVVDPLAAVRSRIESGTIVAAADRVEPGPTAPTPEPPAPPAIAPEPAVVAAPRKVHVLVVEDEPIVRELATRVLRDAGYVVVAASGPVAAVETLYADRRIDLLLSDIVMPAMSGFELAKQVRTLVRPDLPVVLMSGYSETLPRLSDVSIGFLSKPFTPSTLLAAVRSSLL